MTGIAAAWPFEPSGGRTDVRLRGFVEVEAGSAHDERLERSPRVMAGGQNTPDATADAPIVADLLGVEPRWSLWGEPEA